MGSSLGSTHRGLLYWQVSLLVVSLLNFWSQPTTAQVAVESVNALESTDVILHLRNKPQRAEYYLWYRGRIIDSYSSIAYLSVNQESHVRGPPGGQVMVNDDGSLVLKNVSMTDDGIYTVMVQIQGCHKMIACGLLNVYPVLSVPTIQANKTTVREKDAVVMTCYTNAQDIQWLFNGINLHHTERMKLSLDHRSLTIYPVLKKDAGYYQCRASNPLNSINSAQLKLRVKSK